MTDNQKATEPTAATDEGGRVHAIIWRVAEASRLMRSKAPAERRAGRRLLVALSVEHGHGAVERAQAAARLLPPGHMAYWD